MTSRDDNSLFGSDKILQRPEILVTCKSRDGRIVGDFGGSRPEHDGGGQLPPPHSSSNT